MEKYICDKATYIDNDYICWYTGKRCTNYNQNDCILYDKKKGEQYGKQQPIHTRSK